MSYDTLNQPTRQDRPHGRVLGREAPAELLEIGTYGSAAHHTAHHIEVVGVGHVLHLRGHPPADGGVREFNSLFVERGQSEHHLGFERREREREREKRAKSVKIRKIEIPKYSLFWIW